MQRVEGLFGLGLWTLEQGLTGLFLLLKSDLELAHGDIRIPFGRQGFEIAAKEGLPLLIQRFAVQLGQLA
ncbi:hypothetical protein D3C85_1892750 [compost metagenome]